MYSNEESKDIEEQKAKAIAWARERYLQRYGDDPNETQCRRPYCDMSGHPAMSGYCSCECESRHDDEMEIEELEAEVKRLNKIVEGLRNENVGLKNLKERKAVTKIHMQLRQELEDSKQEVKRLKRLLIKLAGFLYRFTANAEQYAEEINKEVEKDYKLIDATQFMNNLSNKEGVKEEFNRRGYKEQLEAMDELVRLSEEMGLYNNED